MPRSTYKTIADDVKLVLGNRDDVDVLIREKINAAARLIGTLTPHKNLMTSATFSLTNLDFEYDLAEDHFAVLSVRNVTDAKSLVRDHYFRLDKIDETVTGEPTSYAIFGNTLYIFNPVPDSTARTIKYRYWQLHPYIEQPNTQHSLDEVWDDALKMLSASMVLSSLNRHAEAAGKWQQYGSYVASIMGRKQAEDLHDQVSAVVYGRGGYGYTR